MENITGRTPTDPDPQNIPAQDAGGKLEPLVEVDFTRIEQDVAIRLAGGLRYTGTYEKTTWQVVQCMDADYRWNKECRPVKEVCLDVLDAGTRAVLGAIWRAYILYSDLEWQYGFGGARLALIREVAREAMANLVLGVEHLHTSACEAGQKDCPIFAAGEEFAKETVGEWIDLSDFHQEFP